MVRRATLRSTALQWFCIKQKQARHGAELCGRRRRHEGGETAGEPKKKKNFYQWNGFNLKWHETWVKLKRRRWDLRTHQFISSSPVGWGANKGGSQLSCVFSSAPGLSADDTHITMNLHNKATFVWGRGPLCVQQHGCADKHTNVTLSFCEQAQLYPTVRRSNGNAHMFAASPQPPFAAWATLHSECGQSVSPCLLISLRRHRAWKYTTEQRVDSFLQQRAQANRSRDLNKDERGEVLLRGWQRRIWQTPEIRPKAWLLHHPSCGPSSKRISMLNMQPVKPAPGSGLLSNLNPILLKLSCCQTQKRTSFPGTLQLNELFLSGCWTQHQISALLSLTGCSNTIP